MKQTIVPDKQTVEEALKNRTYFVDFYQREYVWSKETVDVLLRDIFYSFELSYELYKDSELTPEVLEKYNWYYLNIFITNNVNGKSYIVDGQQRLSTLTLIATKLYHLVDDEDLKDALKACIYSKDKWKGSVFNIDHGKMVGVMNAILKDADYGETFKNKTEETLINRYADISRYFDSKGMDAVKLRTFVHYFLERLVLVELTIEKDDTPMIFEVINDRGEALKPFEILKGKLIGALSKDDTYDFSSLWDGSMERLFDIQDDFFIDYIKSQFIFKRNTKVEMAINQAYHRYLFESNEIAESLGFRKHDKKQIDNVKDFIKSRLEYYSSLYSRIRRNYNEYLEYLNTINTFQGQYQIIMAACDIDDPQEHDKIVAIAMEYDRLYVLLRLNGVYDSNSFQEISYSLNEAVKGRGVDEYRGIFDGMLLSTLRQKKNREARSLLEYSEFLKANYTNLDTRFMRYLLARVEKYICQQSGRDMQSSVKEISTRTGYKTGYHIEHVLSNNDTNRAYFGSEEEFETRRNQLGGLLLLKGLDNISSGNEEYPDKLKTYSAGLVWGHSLCKEFYHTNKDWDAFNDRLEGVCGMRIKSYDRFDAQALEERNRLLYSLIKEIWDVKD